MKNFLLIVLPLFLSSIITSAQNVNELDKRNGFQDIKMATFVKDYEGLEYKKDIKHRLYPSAQLYVAKKGFYENIGDLKIYDLEVLVYRDSVFQIKIITDKDPLLYKGLKTAFGVPEFSPRTGKSQWNGNKVKLTFDDHSKRKMEMVYFSHEMTKKLREDKQEEVEVMSEEF